MSAALMLHCGAREVVREELDAVPTPAPSRTWFPLPHGKVLDTAMTTLGSAGFEVERSRLSVSPDGARFFGTLDLKTPLVEGVNLAVGIRNSNDKSLPISFCAGSRVFVCDNLAFRSEMVVIRKHTRFGESRFNEAICKAVQSLNQYREVETQRIRHFQQSEVSEDVADALMLRAFERQIVTQHQLPKIIAEWRKPSFEDFEARTMWSLFNCFTTILRDRQKSNPQHFAATTIRLHDFFAQHDSPSVFASTIA